MQPTAHPLLNKVALGDYVGIRSGALSPTSDLDRYILVRAFIILGEITEAKSLFENLKRGWESQRFFFPFLELQLSIFETLRPTPDQIQKLLELAQIVPPNLYLQGEYYFFLGYAHNLSQRYRLGVAFHQQAVDYYRLSSLPTPEAIALYNLGVSYKHIHHEKAYLETVTKLEALAKNFPEPGVQYPYKRALANKLVDQEDFEGAALAVDAVLRLSGMEKRRRDLSSILIQKAFILASLPEKAEEFRKVLQEFEAQVEVRSEHKAVIDELKQLTSKAFITEKELSSSIERWKKLAPIHSVRLLYIAAEMLCRSVNPQGVLKVGREAKTISLLADQVPHLVDFGAFEAQAYILLGKYDKAEGILFSYLRESTLQGAKKKIEKASELQKELMRLQEASSLKLEQGLEENIILYPLEKEVVWRKKRHSMNGCPTLFAFLQLLATSSNGVTVNELHESIYQEPYRADRHAKRINSLVERARKLLGTENILRSQSQIYYARHISCTVRQPTKSNVSKRNRREYMLELIKGQTGPVSISEIEKWFDCHRRTLQIDLNELVQAKLLNSTGGTQACKYFIGSRV